MNVLRAALHAQIPNGQKRQQSHQCRFALLGPTRVKAAHKTLMKLTPYSRTPGYKPLVKNPWLRTPG